MEEEADADAVCPVKSDAGDEFMEAVYNVLSSLNNVPKALTLALETYFDRGHLWDYLYSPAGIETSLLLYRTYILHWSALFCRHSRAHNAGCRLRFQRKALKKPTVDVGGLRTLRLESLTLVFQPLTHTFLVNKL